MFDTLEKYERIILAALILTLIAGMAVIVYKRTRPAVNIEIKSFTGKEEPPDIGRTPSPEQPIININIAAPEELAKLKGIGPSLAKRIVDHRMRKGPYRSKEEIKDVKGIGEVLYGNIKDAITTE